MSELAKRIAELTPEKRKLLAQKLQKKLLSQQLQGDEVALAQKDQILPQQREGNVFPLSFAQRRLWFLQQLEPQSAFYNMPAALRLAGRLCVDALERSLTTIVQRHEVLRTTFPTQQEQPVQVVAPSLPIYIRVIDLHGISADRLDSQINALAHAEAQCPFDLANGPLLRVYLLRLGQQTPVVTVPRARPATLPTPLATWEHVLLLTFHHIVSDGWSTGIFVREIAALYQAQINGEDGSKAASHVLPALPIQYADYTLWQRAWLQGQVMESQLAYWRKQLADAPALLELPTDWSRPAVQSYAGAQQSLLVSPELLEQLKSLSQREGVTLFMMLLAAFQVLLMRYSGQQDIVVGTPIANRTREELEGLIGFFVNTLVLRTDLSGNLSFLQLLARVREVALQAYAHQDVPFEKLQVLFSLDNAPLPSFELAGLSFRSMSVESQTAKFDLSLMLNEEDTGLHTVVEYNTDLFEDATMTRLLEHWQVLLETIVHHPEQNIETLPLLTEADREQLLMQWNTTSYDATSAQTDAAQDLCLHQLFERQVEQTPDAVAVVFEEQQVSYQQLNDQANHLAYRLREIGIGPDCLVGVCMERSLELLVGLLAVLKAGGAYVPLDPAYPQDRLAFLLEDAQVPVVLTQTQLYDRLTPFGIETICVEASPGHPQGMSLQWDGSACDARSSHCRGIPCGWTGVQPENLAYVIYTSGSTGKPKGVMVTHANVTRLFAITNDRFHFQSQDTWTFFHSSTFDFSVWEIWGSLLYGSRLVVVPYWQSRSPTEFYHLLVTEQVTILNQTPSAFGQLIQADLASVERMDLALRLVIFGGEALDCRRLRPWFADHADQHPQLVNMYGITETTVHVTYYPITQTDVQVHRGSIIGGPLPAVQCYVLDAHQQLVPSGIAGELYIGGVGLARGYWQNASLTAERFVPHPFAGAIARASAQPGARLYRTGDLVRYLPTGRLEYLGRIDSQVKLRGFRIELGEVEATLQAHPAVKEAVVVLREEDEARKALAAYVVAQAGESLTLEQVRKYLREQLPDYMVPSYVVFLEALPLTLNGKVDRKALPPPVLVRHESTFELPRKPAEHTLVDIWQQVLGLSQVGVHDNFFALGGDSILSMQIIGRARQAGLQLTTKQLFQHQTIAQLAMVAQPLEQQSERVKMIGSGLCLEPPPGGFSPADFPLARLDQVTLDRLLAEREHLIEDIYLLTPLQQGLLFHTLSEPRSGVYIEQVSYTLRGEVEVGAFKRAWQQVIARHMILRTAFVWQEVSEPLQIVFKQVKLPLSILDWRNLPPEQQEADLAAFLQADRAEGFDVGQAPLMRLTLVWLSKTRTQVIWTHHHLLLDGWSISLLAQEVLACYEAAIQGQRLADAEPRPYRDYISWLAEQKNETAELYWRQVLAGIVAPTPLGVDRREREVQAARVYAEEVLQVDAATTANCQRYASREHVTVSTLVQAAWALVLARYSGQTDVIFGMVVAGRPPELAGIERMIGLFINTVPVRVQMNGEEEAGVWLARLQEQQIEQRSYEYSSLVQVQGWSEIPRAHPLFESLLAFENYPVPVTLSAEGKHVDVATKLAPVEGVHVIEHTNYPLTIVVAPAAKSEPGASMGLLASYDRQRFERATIQRLLGHLQNCLQQLVADPQQRLATISLLTKAEREQSLVQWNATRTDYPRQVCVHQLFEQRARQTPDCVALVFEDEALTYAELNRLCPYNGTNAHHKPIRPL
ncbi:MAG: amino acid adenylation domain-containing protein [Chloroflexi bacterium]|nr:MAG: amino acid adenylation domain-containing protein [Chloroflexota bacterium]